MKPIEILSPAGSFDSMTAALNSGAHSIYFGVEQLNMRTCSSAHFTIEDISEISQKCKAKGAKAYITLNTVMYDHDNQLLNSILKQVKKNKIDAVITSDFAVIEKCRQLEIPIHISTQANVSNLESVRFFATFADVIVLARELTLKQIEYICQEILKQNIIGPSGQLVKIEVFVHGALCMAVSGKCYLSLHSQNASANRGACVQNCRRPYQVIDKETGEELIIDNEYIMSPQDLCALPILDQIIKCGVDVLKIERRSKGADYVHIVTKCYLQAVDSIKDNTFTQEKINALLTQLKTVYNRGFWEGYYLGRNLGEWTQNPGSQATEKKVYVGKGKKYYNRIKVGEFLIESGTIKTGDVIMISGPDIGYHKEKMDNLVVNGIVSQLAIKHDLITFPINTKIGPKDKLYKIIQTAEIENNTLS